MTSTKTFSIHFDADLLKQFDQIAGERKRSELLDIIIADAIKEIELKQTQFMQLKNYHTSSAKLTTESIEKLDNLVGKRQRSAAICKIMKMYLEKQNE